MSQRMIEDAELVRLIKDAVAQAFAVCRNDAPTHFSPNQIAKSRGVSVKKVHGWIESGELKAVDYASKRGGKLPRWKISAEALADFDKRRSSGPPAPKPSRRLAKPTTKEYV